jgi:uncharacterized membrane protein (UPF0127 family)
MRSLIALGIVLTVVVAILIGIALFLGSIGSDAQDANTIEREPLTIVTAEGDVARLEVEVADETPERTVGLSGREEVPDGTGMLFVFESRGAGFWMKDTLVALSVAFMGRCGEIVDIQDMQPLSLDLHQAEADFSFGLEVPQGWFRDNGIEVGDLVSIPRKYRPDGC